MLYIKLIKIEEKLFVFFIIFLIKKKIKNKKAYFTVLVIYEQYLKIKF